MLVNDFLLEHFPQIMDYQFTAHIEDELDEIANGKMDYHEMLDEFYPRSKKKLNTQLKHPKEYPEKEFLEQTQLQANKYLYEWPFRTCCSIEQSKR